MKRLPSVLILAAFFILRTFLSEATAQTYLPATPRLDKPRSSAVTEIPSNSVSHIMTQGKTLWIGTGKGAARSDDGGRGFVSYRGVPQFLSPGIFALDLKGDTVWCSTGYVEDLGNGASVQTGSGYAFSFDRGATWSSAPQPLDARDDSLVTYGINQVRFLPIVVPEQNVTFDLAIGDSAVWVASWSSGLRKTTDHGLTWQRIVLPSQYRSSISPTDTLTGYEIDPRLDNNFLLFSVYLESPSIIWAGSAGGINRSSDGGVSWSKFTISNQSSPILGNWIISIKGQKLRNRTRIWAANWPADTPGERYAVSCTDDSGRTWNNFLVGIKAYDFAFRDSVIYVASEQGLYRSSDGGFSWAASGSIVDPAAGQIISTRAFYAAGAIADTVYGGSADGLVATIDNGTHQFGESWRVIRTNTPLPSPAATYAYPNPFSPRLEVVRLHYSTGGSPTQVTIEVFDFGMNRVRTVVRDAPRDGTRDHDEIWDGRNESGTLIPNGVYFYRVTLGTGTVAWGKVMVIQ